MKIRTFVLYIMGSEERRYAWADVCPVQIPLDVDTRWNALYLMMIVARKYMKEIAQFGRKYPACKHLIPTEAEWVLCEQVERCLEPFYNHTLTVSNNVPSLPQYLGIMWGLEDLLDAVSSGEAPYDNITSSDLKGAFEAAKEALGTWRDHMLDNDIYFAAHVLDPRIKFTLIREQYGDGADDIIERVKEYFRQQYPPPANIVENRPEALELERPHRVLIHEQTLLQRSRKINQLNRDISTTTHSPSKSDFDRYLEDPVITEYEPCEDWCLQWWKANQFQYKQVAVAVRDLLAIPAAEVDVERLFSEGRDQLGIRRMAMGGDTMRIQRLMKSYYDQKDKDTRAIAQAKQAEHTALFGVSPNPFIF